jgi:starch-binding outer membrane protein, SusD/RagB family
LPMSQNLFQFNAAPEIRLAEIYYSLAECKYRAGDKAGAAVLLDAVRERNFDADDWDTESYQADLDRLTDDEFVDELGREFLGERHRRTDLIRWNRFGAEWWDKPADGADKSIFPIPNQAINANPLLKPNGAN